MEHARFIRMFIFAFLYRHEQQNRGSYHFVERQRSVEMVGSKTGSVSGAIEGLLSLSQTGTPWIHSGGSSEQR